MKLHRVILFPRATSPWNSLETIEFPDAALRGIDVP